MYLSKTKVFTYTFSVIAVALICTVLSGYAFKPAQSLKQPSTSINKAGVTHTMQGNAITKNTSPSVVELFTSEGCSSCPSADKLVAVAQKEFGDNTIVLSYHVDYWDRLGWKDPFSKSVYSERQRQYARHFNLESVYTPQAIVNGKTEFVGSNKSALWNAISNYKGSGNNIIETETPVVSNQQLSVKYNYAALRANENVVLELVLKNASTQVKRGENSGAILSHINIVQDIVLKNESKGTATFNLPSNFTKENYIVVAFVQNKESFEISNAKKIANI
ncbi:MAG: DUF1223 domain-containing protein [Rhizobacter sp.]|nr:DUF1223 domain-containing protein [Ferruginibacter sp.]